VGDEDSSERVALLARLAAARRDDASRDQRLALGHEAVAIAERIGDPVTLAYALEGHWIANEGPADMVEGREIGMQLSRLGERIGDKERVFAARDFLVHVYWAVADRAALDVEIDWAARLADELRQPAQRWFVGTAQTMLALMEGRFEDAERLIVETLAIGERALRWNAQVSERLGLFVLRRAQGRLDELETAMARAVHEFPTLLRFRCALANVYAELGRERDARGVVDELVSRDLADEHVDAEWLFSMSLLPDPCAYLGDRDGAAKLHEILLPFRDLYSHAPVEAAFGSIARCLGVLATTLGRFDEAEEHFALALETETHMRARPWFAHAQHDLAKMLLARGGRGDRARAGELLGEAAAAYSELGMPTWAERARTAG
jgi:tetratricopeptide (TPR) repeat protein